MMPHPFVLVWIAAILCRMSTDAYVQDRVACTRGKCRHARSSAEAGDAAPPLAFQIPGIDNLGDGYDIFQGNPHFTDTDSDPGYKQNKVFRLAYNKQKQSYGKLSPDDTTVTANSDHECTIDFKVNVIHGTPDYRVALDDEAKGEFSLFGARFSASSDFKYVKEHTEYHDNQFYSASATCISYQATLDPKDELSVNFTKTVMGLPTEPPTNITRNDYPNFIKAFGTHYVKQVTMGGQYGYRSRFATGSVVEMVSGGMDVTDVAKLSAAHSASGKSLKPSDQIHVDTFNSNRLDVTTFISGGTSNKIVDGAQWLDSVTKNPMPISYQLETLSSLFDQNHFPTVTDIAKRRQLLEASIKLYCENQNLFYCKSSSPDPPLQITNAIVTDYTKVRENYDAYWTPDLSAKGKENYRVMGTLLSCQGIDPSHPEPHSTLVLDKTFAPRAVVREAIDWKLLYYNDQEGYAFFRPLCSDGFTSISDFLIYCPHCGPAKNWNKDKTFPKNLPCLSTQCVTTCTKQVCHIDGHGYMGGTKYGYAAFANNATDSSSFPTMSFFRFGDATAGSNGYYQCLLTDCLMGY